MSLSKYWLQNDAGERLSLCAWDTMALKSVQGLGANFEHVTADLENGFFSHVYEKNPSETITAELLIKGDAYRQYRELMNWLQSAEHIYFVYCPFGNDEYFTEVKLNFITKVGRKNGWATMPISFIRLTPWYKPVSISVDFSVPSTATFFAWDVSRLGIDRIASNVAGTFSADVQAEGHLPAAVKITFNGHIGNPAFTLKDVERDVVYGRCELNGSYTGEVVLDTRYADSKVSHNGADIINDLNLMYDPFFRVPVGRPCVIEAGGNDISGSATVEIYEYYRSV